MSKKSPFDRHSLLLLKQVCSTSSRVTPKASALQSTVPVEILLVTASRELLSVTLPSPATVETAHEKAIELLGSVNVWEAAWLIKAFVTSPRMKETRGKAEPWAMATRVPVSMRRRSNAVA